MTTIIYKYVLNFIILTYSNLETQVQTTTFSFGNATIVLSRERERDNYCLHNASNAIFDLCRGSCSKVLYWRDLSLLQWSLPWPIGPSEQRPRGPSRVSRLVLLERRHSKEKPKRQKTKGQDPTNEGKHRAGRRAIRENRVGDGRQLDVVAILRPVSMSEAQRLMGKKLSTHPHH